VRSVTEGSQSVPAEIKFVASDPGAGWIGATSIHHGAPDLNERESRAFHLDQIPIFRQG
jgi:hypothetical protein